MTSLRKKTGKVVEKRGNRKKTSRGKQTTRRGEIAEKEDQNREKTIREGLFYSGHKLSHGGTKSL